MKQLYDITSFGAVTGSEELQTESIQAAIDAAFLAGGGEVVVPAGTFHTACIRLRSNITFHLLSASLGKTVVQKSGSGGYHLQKLQMHRSFSSH